jgi:transposase
MTKRDSFKSSGFAGGLPLSTAAPAARAHECNAFETLLNTACIARRRPPSPVDDDRGCTHRSVCTWLAEREIKPVIPIRPDHRRLTLHRLARQRRDVAEPCIGWLKRCRQIALSYDKLTKAIPACSSSP